ncbi:uncharacterized protein LOC135161270 [Diachasmimorpha longicaudata]|uniref:uncharacterized protein LOC135161270 n=1 Tax=Diachasmimorpha longicaudata TaxID=58733 RepID=UPI0030B87E98
MGIRARVHKSSPFSVEFISRPYHFFFSVGQLLAGGERVFGTITFGKYFIRSIEETFFHLTSHTIPWTRLLCRIDVSTLRRYSQPPPDRSDYAISKDACVGFRSTRHTCDLDLPETSIFVGDH